MKTVNLYLTIFLCVFGMMSDAQTVQWSISDTNGIQGDTLIIPVRLEDDVTGMNIVSFEAELRSIAGQIDFLEVITTNTLSEYLGAISYNIYTISSYNYIQFSAAGSQPMVGSGVLFYIKILGSHSRTIEFTGTNRLNEGSPIVTTDNGYVSLSAPPTISVSPNTATLVVGDQRQFYTNGGTAPYQYAVSDTTVATIDSGGLLTGLSEGSVYVQSTDSTGTSDWSDEIRVRTFDAWVEDGSATSYDTIEVALNVSDISSHQVISGEAEFYTHTSRLRFVDFIQAGSRLDQAQINWTKNISGGTEYVSMVFATTQPLVDSLPLVYLRLAAQPNVNNTSGAVYLDQLILNESLTGVLDDGVISITGIPNLSISPSTNQSLFVYDSLQFTASFGSPPYSFEVFPADRGTIDSTGLFVAQSGGYCRVQVTDVNQQSALSGQLEVFNGTLQIDDRCAGVGDTVRLPVYLSVLANAPGITAFEMTFDYREPELTYLGHETMGTMLENWTVLSTTLGNGDEKIIAAGTDEELGDQVVVYLVFLTNSQITTNEHAYVQFHDFVINEGDPHVLDSDGGIRENAFAITNVEAGTQTGCNSSNNLFDQEIIVHYNNHPGSGNLIVNDSIFPITGSPQTIVLEDLFSDGKPRHISARFSSVSISYCDNKFYNVFNAPDSCFSPPVIVFVDSAASGANNGLSWENAFDDLQDALAMARNQKVIEVWVAKGTYYPTTSTNRAVNFMMVDSLPIYGGFLGNENIRNQRNPSVNITVLSGNIGNTLSAIDNSYHVIFTPTSVYDALVDGFVIQDGRADGASLNQRRGGGLYHAGGLSVHQCTIQNNHADLEGSGIYAFGNSSLLTINESSVLNNSTNAGGPIYVKLGADLFLDTNVTIDH